MRRQALLLLQHTQAVQQHAAQSLAQIAALHGSSLQSPGSTGTSQQDQLLQSPHADDVSQQAIASVLKQQQAYHAAVAPEVQQMHQLPRLQQPVQQLSPHLRQQHQRQQRLQQQQQQQQQNQQVQGMQHYKGPAAANEDGLRRQLQSLHRPARRSHSSDSSDGSKIGTNTRLSSGLSAAAAAVADVGSRLPDGVDADEGDSVFLLSSYAEQYQQTLAHLHMGHSKNLDQLAWMFEPQAVLAAPDKGAAVLEALMFAAAKLRDLQLLRQLLRCMAAAGNPLSTTGHSAVLHGLAHCDRPVEALEWLQTRVPGQQLSPQMLRALVQPLLQAGHLQAAEQALDWAAARLAQAQQQGMPAADAAHAGAGQLASYSLLVPSSDQQVLPCLRLMLAGAKGTLAAVQQEWSAIQQQQAQLVQQQHQQHPGLQHLQPGLPSLGVQVYASYAVALSKTARQSKWGSDSTLAANQLKVAMDQLGNEFHAVAWARYLQRAAAKEQENANAGGAAGPAVSGSQVQQLQQQQQQRLHAQQLWQSLKQQQQQLDWQDLNPALVLPQQVVAAAQQQERALLKRALDAALHVAATQQDEQWMQELLQQASLLKCMPRSWGFDALLNFKLQQGLPPEAIEELFSELMGWGITPSLSQYEAVMEAYALHRDLPAAESVLDRLQAAGHSPLLRTYNRLLHGVANNGDLSAAIRVYNRLKLQGLKPDEQTMRCLFKCVRLYAANVRVITARRIAQAKAGDREAIWTLLSQRSALFASAYSQLALWQGHMAAAGLKHTSASMTHLTAALERLGAMEDCLQLAKLHEQMKPGDFTAHHAAIKVAGRARDTRTAGEVSNLATQLAQGQALTRQDYLAIINSQFWLNQDHEQLLKTIAAMKAAGHALDAAVLLQLMHVYCHNGMWGEALQVLDDVAAGRVGGNGGSSSRAVQQSRRQQPQQQQRQRLRADRWTSHYYGGTAGNQQQDQEQNAADHILRNDRLWHVVMRKLWERRAADDLLNDFVQRMHPAQLQRFKLLYGLQPAPGQPGHYTLQPVEDWQVPLRLQQQPLQEQAWHLEQPLELERLQDQEEQQQLPGPA